MNEWKKDKSINLYGVLFLCTKNIVNMFSHCSNNNCLFLQKEFHGRKILCKPCIYVFISESTLCNLRSTLSDLILEPGLQRGLNRMNVWQLLSSCFIDRCFLFILKMGVSGFSHQSKSIVLSETPQSTCNYLFIMYWLFIWYVTILCTECTVSFVKWSCMTDIAIIYGRPFSKVLIIL